MLQTTRKSFASRSQPLPQSLHSHKPLSTAKQRLKEQAALEEEEARKLAMTVQQWHRSRTQNKMNVLKGGSADGRQSVFMLPDALSKLKPISER